MVVRCLDNGEEYLMDASTAYEAMRKMLYYLNLSKEDKSTTINKTESGLHLWMEHLGKMYAVCI
jgi:hypothetical protein